MSDRHDEILRVHLDAAGDLWLGQFGVCAARANKPWKEFLRHDVLGQAECLHVEGSAVNAPLIAALFERRAKRHKPLRIVAVQPSGSNRPESILHQLWQPCLGAARAHEVGPREYATYALIAAAQEARCLTTKVRYLLARHPARPALDFVSHLDDRYAVQLLAEIVDPRWYLHPDHPNRPSRLYSYLGLRPGTFRRLFARQVSPAEAGRAVRAHACWRAWCGEGQVAPADIEEPRRFLWRIARRGPADLGYLRATQVFLRFVTLVWLQGLAPAGQRVFDPESFFKRPAEVEEYRRQVTPP